MEKSKDMQERIEQRIRQRAELKAQEPVKPIVGHNIGPTWWYACGECNGAIDIGDKFCRHCGRELKWES